MLLQKCSRFPVLSALVLAGTVGLATPAASAASVSINTLTSPFPSNLAYPGFSDYTLVNLTTIGSLDWIRVGEDPTTQFLSTTGFNEKAGASIITNYAQTGVASADGSSHHFLSYTDASVGLPASMAMSDQLLSRGQFSFQAAASTNTRELSIFAGVQASTFGAVTGTLTATLFNASGAQIGSSQSATLSATSGNGNSAVFQVDYSGNSPTDYVQIVFARTAASADNDFISLSGAAVSPTPLPSAAWGGMSLLAAAGVFQVVRSRRARPA